MSSETEVPAQTPNAAPAISDSQLQDLDKSAGQGKLRDMDSATRSAYMERIKGAITEAENPSAAPAETEKPIQEPKETPKEEAAKAEPKEAPKAFDRREARRSHQMAADEANQWEQKAKTLRERAERAKKEYEELAKTEVKAPDDPWDKDHQTNLHKTVEDLKRENAEMKAWYQETRQKEIDEVTATAKEKRESALFGSIHSLQDEYTQLKTSKPFKELEAENVAWLTNLVERSGVKEALPGATPDKLWEAANKRYESDPEFAKSIPAHPFSKEDTEKYRVISELNAKARAEGGSIRGHWLEKLDDEGILEEVMQKGRQSAAEDAASRTVKAIQKASTDVQPIAPSDGSAKNGYLDPEWTPAKAATIQSQLVAKHKSGKALNPSERELLKKVQGIIKDSYLGVLQ